MGEMMKIPGEKRAPIPTTVSHYLDRNLVFASMEQTV
jgi:hypothetical protein